MRRGQSSHFPRPHRPSHPRPPFSTTRYVLLLLLLVLLTGVPVAQSARLPPQLTSMLKRMRKCQPSSLPGYSSSVPLYGGLVLHWQASSGSVINLALQAKTKSPAAAGWSSVGWSSTGEMAGSDAVVVGGPAAASPNKYYIGGYTSFSRGAFSLGSPSISRSASDGMVLKFSRSTTDGKVPVRSSGASSLVWAYGSSAWSPGAASSQHDGRGTTSVDFSCNACRVFLFKLC